MSVIWLNKKQKDGYVTITANYITLNKQAVIPMETANMVMIGIDEEHKEVLIRPLDAGQVVRGDIEIDSMYKITINSSYGRITSKDIIKEICKIFSLEFNSDILYRFVSEWNATENILHIKMDKEAVLWVC